MSRKQTVVLVDHFANDKYLDHVKVVQQDVPEPKDGEVLVQVLLRPIHPADHMTMQNGFGGALPLPLIPGSEGTAGKFTAISKEMIAMSCACAVIWLCKYTHKLLDLVSRTWHAWILLLPIRSEGCRTEHSYLRHMGACNSQLHISCLFHVTSCLSLVDGW